MSAWLGDYDALGGGSRGAGSSSPAGKEGGGDGLGWRPHPAACRRPTADAFRACPLFIGGPVTKNLLHVLHARRDVEGALEIIEVGACEAGPVMSPAFTALGEGRRGIDGRVGVGV
jgi:hypothetical protein